MDAPGTLPARVRLAPLRRVLPSRFTRLAACALREALAEGGQAALLPTPPGSVLGTIAHKLLERAGRGEFAGWTAERVYEEWDRMVAAAEERQAASWLDRHLVPLSQTYRRYAVRRIQACERAAALAASLGEAPAAGGSGVRPRRECEAWVETADGLAGGFVDAIERTAADVVIRDYKSGALEEPGEPGEEPRVKESYRAQMMLYAAIINERDGIWPVSAELESLDGSGAVALAIEPSECSELLAAARSLLSRANRIIRAVLAGPAADLRPLAAPCPSTCRFCEFRPACEAYWEARGAEPGDWPHDVRGTVRKKTALGLGTAMLEIEPDGGATATVRVRGLVPARHPALALLGEGDRVTICNLRPDGPSGALAQAPLTAVYAGAGPQAAPGTEPEAAAR